MLTLTAAVLAKAIPVAIVAAAGYGIYRFSESHFWETFKRSRRLPRE